MIDTPHLARTDALPTAVIHLTVPRAEIQAAMGPAREELMATLAAQGVAPAGPWFSHHFGVDPDTFDFEVGLPVAGPVSTAGRVRAGEFPAATVARTVYHGGYEGLGPAWGEFEAWIASEGHATRADLWERYVTGPESGPDPSAWRTELNHPLTGDGRGRPNG